jgi:Protein of unknown function (DUF992)
MPGCSLNAHDSKDARDFSVAISKFILANRWSYNMHFKSRLMLIGAVVLAAFSFAGIANADPKGVKVGSLTCNVSSGWGFVFGSSKNLHCTFRQNNHAAEHYVGTIDKFGVDVGYTEGGVLIWAVVAPTSDVHRGALTGDYAGATASATVGVGVGANVLIGGLDKSIALQPVSVEGNEGLNVAAGIGAISLKSAPIVLGGAL